ncbi:TadE/TadG family type IV pilus assembly protein [Jannaschia sp. W003]|uniref:TadE/TadG family type IV pilus assembly protein n=1 Tax=Jannaschia sp. W003 TaxID=2867012 RepID=UPI0021A7D8D4|nr:TadE family protein [Jannaschia sp. W003]UWQ20029.1 pilus assembly protein [Jannaschia sp. W003]
MSAPGPARAAPLAGRLARGIRRGAARLDRAIGLTDDRREDGQATVEFVILFPIFMALFLSAFESSLMLTRQLMLERALDIVMRDVRLATGTDNDHDDLRTSICERAPILPQCDSNLVIEITDINPPGYDLPADDAPCVDRTVAVQAYSNDSLITKGARNQLMLVRACFAVDPVFPGTGVGLALLRSNDGDVQLLAATAFVQEP